MARHSYETVEALGDVAVTSMAAVEETRDPELVTAGDRYGTVIGGRHPEVRSEMGVLDRLAG